MLISSTMRNLESIEQVVELINQNGTNEFDGNEYAAQYALMGIEGSESPNEITDITVCFWLDCLVEEGAEFDYDEAHELAIKEAVDLS